MGGRVVPVRRPVMRTHRATFADVDKAVARSRAKHRREGWRRLGSGLLLGYGRRRFRHRLLRRRERLVGRGLLRGRR